MKISEAYDAPAEWVKLEDAKDRVAADFVIVYPPDAPLIVPGETFTEDILLDILRKEKEGLTFLGIRNGCVKVMRG